MLEWGGMGLGIHRAQHDFVLCRTEQVAAMVRRALNHIVHVFSLLMQSLRMALLLLSPLWARGISPQATHPDVAKPHTELAPGLRLEVLSRERWGKKRERGQKFGLEYPGRERSGFRRRQELWAWMCDGTNPNRERWSPELFRG